MPRIILITCLIVLFHSCTMQKRVYQKGWHVEWKQRNSTPGSTLPETDYTSGQDQEKSQNPEQSRARAEESPVTETAATEASNEAIVVENTQADAVTKLSVDLETTAAAQAVPKDSVIVQPYEPVMTPREMSNYSLVTALIVIVFMLLAVACVIAAILIFSFEETILLLLLGIVLFIFALIFGIIRAVTHPEYTARRDYEKKEYKRKETEGTLTEEDIDKTARQKRKALIFFLFFAAGLGAIVYLFAAK